MASYSTSIATTAISRTVSEIHQLIDQKSSNFLTPLYLMPPLGVKPSELSTTLGDEKLEWWGYLVVKEFRRNI